MAKNSQAVSSNRRRQAVNVETVRQWIRESRSELRKVTWPTPEQTRNLTLVVIAVCAARVFLAVRGFGRELQRAARRLEPEHLALKAAVERLERMGE